jgi:GTPase SAR1 family protein
MGIERWIDDINNFGPKELFIILVGNKSDLNEERVVSFQEAVNMARKYSTIYVEVSAKTGNNVTTIFEELTQLMVKKEEDEMSKRKSKKGKFEKSHTSIKTSIQLEKTNIKRSGGCC